MRDILELKKFAKKVLIRGSSKTYESLSTGEKVSYKLGKRVLDNRSNLVRCVPSNAMLKALIWKRKMMVCGL